MRILPSQYKPVIRSDKLYLDWRSKIFIKFNCLITLIALAIASRPDLGKSFEQSLGLLEGQQTMSEVASEAHGAGEGGNAMHAQDSEVHSANKPTYPKMKIKYLKLHKNIGFPALLTTSGRIIPTAELPSFEARIDSWASGGGLEALCKTSEAMIQLADGNISISSYFEDPELGGLTFAEQKRKFFRHLSKTDMGASLCLHDDEEGWSACPKENILDMEQKFTSISAQLSRNLAEALIITGTNHSVLPQYFEGSLALALSPDTPRMLKGFIQLQQIRKYLSRDVQGSCLQQQNEAIRKFDDSASSTKFSVYDAQKLLIDSYGPTHIIAARDIDSRDTFYRRLALAAGNMITRACENDRANPQAGAARQNAAVTISMALTSKKLAEPRMTWEELYTFITGIMSEHLAPLDAYTTNSQGATLQKQSTALGAYAQHQHHGHKSSNSYSKWTCARCGNKGHHERTCKEPFDPAAPAKAELARAEAIRKRTANPRIRPDRHKQQRALEAPPPPPAQPSGAAAPTQHTAGVSLATRMNEGLFCKTERGMFAHTERMGTSSFEQPHNGNYSFLTDLFAILTGCWLAGTVLSLSYHATAGMPLGLSTTAYLILSSLLSGVLLTVMHAESARSVIHLRASTITYVALMIIITASYLLVSADAAAPRSQTAFVINIPCLTSASQSACPSQQRVERTVYVDSGCTKTVFANPQKLINHRPPDGLYTIQGVGGIITATGMGDFPLAIRDAKGKVHTRLIRDCLIAEDAPYNLLATRDVQLAQMGFTAPADINKPATLHFADGDDQVCLELEEHGGLYKLPFCQDAMTCIAGVASHQLRALTLAETWHLRLGHASWEKLAKLSKYATGFSSPIAQHDYPCHTCHEAKARRQNYPPPSEHDRKGVWNMDTIDMGADTTTPAGHRYITIVTILDTRFVMIFLHATKDEFPRILLKAFAQAGKTPSILRTDNASELNSKQVQDILLERGIVKECSNAYEQFGNAPAEIMVNTIDNGVRAALKDANLPLHYWGFAAVNWVDIYNHLPHSALSDKTPWECEKGTPPDVSWFRPFGCRATVYTGMRKDLTEHGKLGPRGVACIYLGLGFTKGHKGWICYDPEGGNLFCTRNVVFDETFMLARTHNQRILGYYDTTPRTRMAKQIHGSMEAAEKAAEDIDGSLPLHSNPTPVADLPAEEQEAIRRKPGDRIDHEEGDALINVFDDDDDAADEDANDSNQAL